MGSTWAERADAIGENSGAVGAEISGEKGKPRGQELRCDSELRRLIIHEERVDGFVSVVVVSHGNGSARLGHSGESTRASGNQNCLERKTDDR